MNALIRRFCLAVCAAGLLGAPALSPVAAAPAPARLDDNDVNVKVDIDYKKLGKAVAEGAQKLWKKLVGKHPIDQDVYRIENKWNVVIVDVTKAASGGRITNGLHLSGVYGEMDDDYRVFFANTGSVDPKSLRMQAKKNEKWSKDGNWGGIIKHGFKGKLPGARDRYFAARSDGWHPGIKIVIVPAAMPLSKLEHLPGVNIKR
ncbi:MAG: hypothetical protein KF678_15515 [Phycisphaeraceae bacterium]|nr:hypothetical protein [Phycisphaeraceae bacterium]